MSARNGRVAVSMNGSVHFGAIEIQGDAVVLTSAYGNWTGKFEDGKSRKVARQALERLVLEHLARVAR